MISRRQLLFAATSFALLQRNAIAREILDGKISWQEFLTRMNTLATEKTSGNLNPHPASERGREYLKELDITSSAFRNAVDSSYESGNNFWLWQRLVKENNINGGILNIYNDNIVQLHDHPNAIGMLRILSGEVEVWQYNEAPGPAGTYNSNTTELIRVSHRILKPGDTATLTPGNGNIHALRAITNECRMIDFFIPPYQRAQRSWFEPFEQNWFTKEKIACKKIPQHEFTAA